MQQTFEIATLWLSALLVGISGFLCVLGYIEHKRSIDVLESVTYLLYKSKVRHHEGTDAD